MLYQSSKGLVEIDTMPFPYANNALQKLLRSEPSRTAEIDALQAHCDKLSAEKLATDSADGENPRVAIGDNGPPADEPTPVIDGRAAIKLHVSDLLSEAVNWADGVDLIDQGQADAVGRLHRKLQEAAALVDDNAAKEKKPHSDAVNEIGVWQNSYTAKGLKKTPDGTLTKAITATGNLSAGWLRKQDDDRRAREKAAADIAAKAAQDALAARVEAKDSTDLSVINRADDALAMAEALIRDAKGVAKERVQSGGGDGYRAMSLRSIWRAQIKDEENSWASAYNHFKRDPEFMGEFRALIQKWADRAVRTEQTRLLGVPGYDFIEDKVV
jgi:hypothetical protein